MKRRALSTSGFSLVELMVVVGIIGILVAIATVSYNGYTFRARQTEAKVALGAIYTAETAFSTENGYFTACLKEAGYSPTLGSSNYFYVGFDQATALLTTCGVLGTTACNIYNSHGATCLTADLAFGDPQTASDIQYAPNSMMQISSNTSLTNEAEAAGLPSAATMFPVMHVTMTSSAFIAGAAAIDAGGHCTGLTIDQNKSLNYPACQ
jgi:prepilin-type N-terminal cleavage/methylation domain-containing protein